MPRIVRQHPGLFEEDEQLSSTTVTYGELLEASIIVESKIEQYKGKMYGIMCKPHIAVACMLGLMDCGPFYSLYPYNSTALLDELAEDTFISCFFVQSSYSKYFRESDSYLKIEEVVICGQQVFIYSKQLHTKLNIFDADDASKYAYMMKTSGSSGDPKLVVVSHKCIVPNVDDFVKIFQITETDVILCISPLTFDPCIVDIFMALYSGATLTMLTEEITKKTKVLKRILTSEYISILQATPSLLKLLGQDFLKTFLSPITNLKVLALGGEDFPTELFNWFDPKCRTKIFNLYGLTEVSCWAAYERVNLPTSSKVPIGFPLTGTSIAIIDEQSNSIRCGTGQIQLHGFRNCNRLFTKKLSNSSEIKFEEFNTGDIGQIFDNNIYFGGREDFTIKRNGKRLNLLEVENIVKKTLVEHACAIYSKNRLILFYKSPEIINREDFKQKLHSIEDYKIPDKYIACNSWPININGKTDRNYFIRNINKYTIDEPSGTSDYVELISNTWKKLLGLSPQCNDNFINCGGDSILAIQFSDRLNYEKGNTIILDKILNETFKSICDACIDFKLSEVKSSDATTSGIESETVVLTEVDHEVRLPRIQIEGLRKLWQFNLGKCIDSTPLLLSSKNNTFIYVGSHSRRFCCINADDGSLIWQVLLPDRIEASPVSNHSRDHIFIGCYDGYMYCLCAKSGKEIFKIQTNDIIKSSAVVNKTNDRILFGSYDKHLYCANENGEVLWKKKLSSGSIFSSPIIINNCVFVATLDGFIFCLDIKTTGVVWKLAIGKAIFSSLVCVKNSIIFGCVDCRLYSISTEGKKQWDFLTKAPIFCTPSVVKATSGDYFISVGSHDYSLYLLNSSGKKMLEIPLSSPIVSRPYIFQSTSNNTIIIACESNGMIHTFDIKDFCDYELKYQLKLEGEIFSSPVFSDRKVYIGCRDDFLYCIYFS